MGLGAGNGVQDLEERQVRGLRRPELLIINYELRIVESGRWPGLI